MGESMEEEGGGYKVGQIYFCLSKKSEGSIFLSVDERNREFCIL